MSLNSFKQGLALDLEMALKKNCPVDTGRLKLSIKVDINGSVLEINLLKYAIYTEFGTTDHYIEPKNAQALHWKSGGKDMFSKGHWVSGIEPNPWIRNTFYHELPRIVKNNAEMHLPLADVELVYE